MFLPGQAQDQDQAQSYIYTHTSPPLISSTANAVRLGFDRFVDDVSPTQKVGVGGGAMDVPP